MTTNLGGRIAEILRNKNIKQKSWFFVFMC